MEPHDPGEHNARPRNVSRVNLVIGLVIGAGLLALLLYYTLQSTRQSNLRAPDHARQMSEP
jgi:hypothetical protein